MFTIIYIVLAVWISAGIVQTRASLHSFTKIAAENLLKYYTFEEPSLQSKFVEIREHEAGIVMKMSRNQCYYFLVSVIYLIGAIGGGKAAMKYKFKPNPQWEELVAKLNRTVPKVRF